MTKVTYLTVFCVSLLFPCLIAAAEFPTNHPVPEDTPASTVTGNPFTIPAGWSATVMGPATIITPPEGGSHIVYVDVEAEDAESALAKAWAAYKEPRWPLKLVDEQADDNGWSRRKRFEYQTSPNERRGVVAGAMFANDRWTVWIYDMASEVSGKRSAAVGLLFASLLPKGYERESFAGLEARELTAARIAELTGFIERGLEVSGVPGTSLGIIQDGEVVFSGGFGVRELGSPEKVDGDTLYMIASNTKGLTTLLLAKLVDEGRIGWKDPVTKIMPGFRLGDEETTAQVLVEHLVCACTGLPRQDMEWILEFGNVTPESSMELLATMQPTSSFGEMFQYSNVLASAAGYVAGHVVHPEHGLGVAYDRAMQSKVFDPLGMTATTFDYRAAQDNENHARPHSVDVNGDPAVAVMGVNYAAIPVRPAGAGWSSVNDMLRYVAMELASGRLPDGERYIGEAALLERRKPQVPVGEDHHYGMGLMVDEYYGTPVVHHGGDLIGYHSDMMWLPEHGVGAVVLTNGDPGWLIRGGFRRKLLEVLFDGKAEADAQLKSASETFKAGMAKEFELLAVPASTEHSAALPSTIVMEFVVGEGEEKTLIMRDAQHEYVFDAI